MSWINIYKSILVWIGRNHPTDPLLDNAALAQRLRVSQWFDATWYCSMYPDVKESGVDPAYHYVHHGVLEGRLASAIFDECHYVSQLDGDLRYQSSFLHFVAEGEKKGLEPCKGWRNGPWWLYQLIKDKRTRSDGQLRSRLPKQPHVAVVVPIHNAPAALERCLNALDSNFYGIALVVLVDDASTSLDVQQLLGRYDERSDYLVLRNDSNIGFSGSINRGIAATKAGYPASDVVLLNSDTQVTAGWLNELRYAAYSEANIATATPISNNAGVFSVPIVGENEIPNAFSLTQFARLCRQAAVNEYPEVPTGHGFCLYIRREALNQVGDFDERAFPRGYGEENDFCMRAASQGWKHVIGPKAFVYHERAASFGTERSELLRSGLRVIEERYPSYRELVSQAFSSKAVTDMREQIEKLISLPPEKISKVRPRAVFVISTRGGGTPLTNQDLMTALEQWFECFVLHCDGKEMTLEVYEHGSTIEVASHVLSDSIQSFPHVDEEYDEVVAGWLLRWTIELVHVRHIAYHSLGLFKVVKFLGLPLINSLHDFYTLCPTVKLLDENMEYCGASCTDSAGRCRHELWPLDAFDDLKHRQIHDWQSLFSSHINFSDVHITTSRHARELFVSKYPDMGQRPFKVIEHGRDFSAYSNSAQEPVDGKKLKLLCAGDITFAKGVKVIQQLSASYSEILEIHVLGRILESIELPQSVVVHGSYEREDFISLAEGIQPNCGAILSIWPETWCHTLTEMWAAGLPVIGLPLGAVEERITQENGGWVASGTDFQDVAQILFSERFKDEWQAKRAAVLRWQENSKSTGTTAVMADQYLSIYGDYLMLVE